MTPRLEIAHPEGCAMEVTPFALRIIFGKRIIWTLKFATIDI
jgi:hypothetical protein